MAKVKIQGNASGTGVLTVTAPNTSTDRTITLPDSTGTLATTTGGVAQLDHSGTKKLEATSTGATLTGDLAINDAHPEITLTDSDDTSYSVAYHSAGAFLIDVDKGQDVANSYFRLSIDDTPRLRVTADGLLFNSDTAAANALDDYEEGTWTPALSGVTGTFATSGTHNYTKVGRIVTLNGYIYNCASISNTSANWLFSGLPFAPIQDCQGAVSTYNVTLTSSNSYVTIRAAANNSSLALVESRAGTTGVLIPFSAVGTGHLDFTITYATNA